MASKDHRRGYQAIEGRVFQTRTPSRVDCQRYAHTQKRWEGKNV